MLLFLSKSRWCHQQRDTPHWTQFQKGFRKSSKKNLSFKKLLNKLTLIQLSRWAGRDVIEVRSRRLYEGGFLSDVTIGITLRSRCCARDNLQHSFKIYSKCQALLARGYSRPPCDTPSLFGTAGPSEGRGTMHRTMKLNVPENPGRTNRVGTPSPHRRPPLMGSHQ